MSDTALRLPLPVEEGQLPQTGKARGYWRTVGRRLRREGFPGGRRPSGVALQGGPHGGHAAGRVALDRAAADPHRRRDIRRLGELP